MNALVKKLGYVSYTYTWNNDRSLWGKKRSFFGIFTKVDPYGYEFIKWDFKYVE